MAHWQSRSEAPPNTESRFLIGMPVCRSVTAYWCGSLTTPP